MTDITININTDSDNKPGVTLETGISKPNVPKAELPKEEPSKDGQKTVPPKEELKKETSEKDQNKATPEKNDAKGMGMTEEEHAKMSSDKESSKE